MSVQIAASAEVSLFEHVAIVGMGLIGASIAGALDKAQPACEIVGVSISLHPINPKEHFDVR